MKVLFLELLMFKNRVRYYWVRYISFFNCYIDLLVSNNKTPTKKDHIQPEHSQNLQKPLTTPFAHKIKIIIKVEDNEDGDIKNILIFFMNINDIYEIR